MASLVRLNDGVELVLELAVAEVQAALEDAVAAGKMLEVRVGDGQFVVLNPQQVLYLQEADPEDSPRAPANGTGRVPQPAAR